MKIASLRTLLDAAKDKLKTLNDKVLALEASLQFTQKEHEEVKDRVATCEKDQIRQENELTRQSIYSRRWNLLFFKINESKDENCQNIVKDVLINSLGIEELGKKHHKVKLPIPIIAWFTCRAERDYVWHQGHNLEGSNIRMAEDLPFHVHEIRKNILVPALKKAKKVANVKASIVSDKLVVNGWHYTFNKIPMQWTDDQVQQQHVPAQEIQDFDDPTTLEFEPSQETSEIT